MGIPEKAMFVSRPMQIYYVIILYCEWHCPPLLGLEYHCWIRDILHWVHWLQAWKVCRFLTSTITPIVEWVASCLLWHFGNCFAFHTWQPVSKLHHMIVRHIHRSNIFPRWFALLPGNHVCRIRNQVS